MCHAVDADGDILYRIKLMLPQELRFENNTDVFEKMTDRQMTDFKDKIEALVSSLNDIQNGMDDHEKYEKLNKIFGDDFEIPGEEQSTKQQSRVLAHSSSSGAM